MSNNSAIDMDELARFRFRTLAAFTAVVVGILSQWLVEHFLQPVFSMPKYVAYGLMGLPPCLAIAAFYFKRVPITQWLKSLGVSKN